MVRKVVIPATISVLTLVLFSLSLNIRSSICVLPRLSRRVCGHCPVQNQPRLLSSPAKLGRCRRHTATEGSETSSVTHDPLAPVKARSRRKTPPPSLAAQGEEDRCPVCLCRPRFIQ